MTDFPWTGGPWSYVRNGMDSRWVIDSHPGRALACTAGFEPDNEANARLISAAPDFAAAAASLIEAWDGSQVGDINLIGSANRMLDQLNTAQRKADEWRSAWRDSMEIAA